VRTAAAPPYLLPPDDAVSVEPWQSFDGTEVGERLEHWDPFTDVELLRAVTVDLDATRLACQLGADSAFALTASWRSDRTRLAGAGDSVELGTLDGRVRAPVALTVPGRSAGGRLDLHVRLVLRTPGGSPSRISPTRCGAILWSDVTRVALEGAGARFPVTAADFTATARLPDSGSWALEWDVEDLDAPVLGGLRLLVNANDEQLLDTLRSGSGDARSSVVRSFVRFDVARSLVHGALRNERFVDDPEVYDDGSVGRTLFELLTACWPGMPVRALRARSIEDPARLDTELQAYLGLFA
jgi:hypothetical protein